MPWYYAQNGQQRGPVEVETLRGLLASGQLTSSDLVWTEGMPQWQPAAAVTALAPQAPSAAAAAAPYVAPYQSAYPPFEQPSQYSGLAVASLVLSLLGLFGFGPLTSIPGAICGHMALKGMRRTGDLRNQAIAQVGFWVGLVLSLCFCLLILLIVVIFVIAAVSAAAGH